MKLTRAQVVALFAAMGFKNADKWDAEKLLSKLKKLPEMVDENTEVNGKEEKNLLKAVIAALKDDKDVTIGGDEKAETKKGGKAKAEVAAEPEETEEETEEEEDGDEEDAEDAEDEEEEEPKKKPAGKKGGGKKGTAPVKVGVIATIVECLKAASKTKPVTKATILEKLTKKFPDKDPKGMKNTINIQVPARIKAEKKLNIVKTDDDPAGYYVK